MKKMKNRYFFSLVFFLTLSTTVALGQTKVIKQKIEKKNTVSKGASSKKSGTPSNKTVVVSNKMSSSQKEDVLRNLIGNMVFVEGGTFVMGATPEQGNDAGRDEKPAHQVTVSSFSIGKFEVTQEEWIVVMGNNPSHFNGRKRPVEQVTWNDCQKFIEKLNLLTGKHFRLPTEAEWEFAARGGNFSRSNKYAGGNNLDDLAWYNENSTDETHDVGKKKSNELGLFDMAGNVWEWCHDCKKDYISTSQQQNADTNRVNRGGSWRSDAKHCRVSFRFDDDADERFNTVGFRLAL